MTVPLPDPKHRRVDPKALVLDYLDYYRAAIATKLTGLTEEELRSSRLPSGWTPIELLKHLVYMERRWLRWGFTGEVVRAPWGDQGSDGRWHVDPGESLGDLLGELETGALATRRIVEPAELSEFGALGGRFESTHEAPTLAWILFHVLQEYARHAGHLDIVRELADGKTGE